MFENDSDRMLIEAINLALTGYYEMFKINIKMLWPNFGNYKMFIRLSHVY